MSSEESPSRVIVWSTPRSISTAFLKCMTFVDNSVAWHEPYVFANRCGPDGTIKAEIDKALRERSGIQLPLVAEYYTTANKVVPTEVTINNNSSTASNVYEASTHSFQWIKEQLESPHPGTDLIFVKDMAQGITGHYDAIPRGYHHTFLMRHPLKVFASYKQAMLQSGRPKDLTTLPEIIIPNGHFFKELHDLYQHVKVHYDPNAIILDADDLLSNPSAILPAYCKRTNIPYNNSLLSWPPGSDEVLSRWMIQKEVLGSPSVLGALKACFDSTCFGPPSSMPLERDLPHDVLELARSAMPYYNAMYEQRMKL